jgi:hypothetical protein
MFSICTAVGKPLPDHESAVHSTYLIDAECPSWGEFQNLTFTAYIKVSENSPPGKKYLTGSIVECSSFDISIRRAPDSVIGFDTELVGLHLA